MSKPDIPSFAYELATGRYTHGLEAVREYLESTGDSSLTGFVDWCLKKIPAQKAKVTRKYNRMWKLIEAQYE